MCICVCLRLFFFLGRKWKWKVTQSCLTLCTCQTPSSSLVWGTEGPREDLRRRLLMHLPGSWPPSTRSLAAGISFLGTASAPGFLHWLLPVLITRSPLFHVAYCMVSLFLCVCSLLLACCRLHSLVSVEQILDVVKCIYFPSQKMFFVFSNLFSNSFPPLMPPYNLTQWFLVCGSCCWAVCAGVWGTDASRPSPSAPPATPASRHPGVQPAPWASIPSVHLSVLTMPHSPCMVLHPQDLDPTSSVRRVLALCSSM